MSENPQIQKINLAEKLAKITENYSPKVVGDLNGQYVKLVKFIGPYLWHDHKNEDEMFLVIKGRFKMELRDKAIQLQEGEFLIIPRGVEHRPVAEDECHVLLFESATTVNTGEVEHEYTRKPDELEHI